MSTFRSSRDAHVANHRICKFVKKFRTKAIPKVRSRSFPCPNGATLHSSAKSPTADPRATWISTNPSTPTLGGEKVDKTSSWAPLPPRTPPVPGKPHIMLGSTFSPPPLLKPQEPSFPVPSSRKIPLVQAESRNSQVTSITITYHRKYLRILMRS